MTKILFYVNFKLMKNNYELTCLISPNLAETEREKVIDKIKQNISKNEGEVITVHPLNEISLAYPIEDQNEACMSIVDLKLDGDKVKELKKELAETQKLLRFFLIKRVKHTHPKLIKEKRVSKVKIGDIDKKIEEILNPSKKDESE